MGDLVAGQQCELVGVEALGGALGQGDLAVEAPAVDAAAGFEGEAGEAGAFAAVGVVGAATGQALAGDLERDREVAGRERQGGAVAAAVRPRRG